MKSAQLAALRFFALLFILPGLAGLIVSAMISTHYLEVMPRGPVLVEGRIVPREIHGIVVYQTEEENRRLNLIEYSSVESLSLASDLVSFIWRSGAPCRHAQAKKKASWQKIEASCRTRFARSPTTLTSVTPQLPLQLKDA